MRVAVLSYPDVALFELASAVELFGLPRPEFADWYECDVVSFEDQPLPTTTGLQLIAKHITTLDAYDMLVVPSWPTNVTPSEHMASELKRFAKGGNRLISFCSGAFLLAELGLFDGREATTHWRYANKFKDRFPAVTYRDNVLYLYDGKIGCSAGSAAGIDLGLEVIRQDHGYDIANQVARRLVLSPHRQGGQAQFVETPVLAVPNQFSETIDWALSHLNDAIDIDTLAARARMSRRTFDRKFRSSFDMSPKHWLVVQRLEKAKRQLEEGHQNMERIAAQSGFDNATTLRHHFRKILSISPRQYRQQFMVRAD
ncbi:helix-turn-helix domain-containing protein [Maribrevibacterium harenarium]|uniref:Helix-turn-helix domain-containing protein n=1 Tax=Maribrevibacterium harenarium TaxID=2589817 RepID=A0A501X439_9GAMM|nr:helix-turn-helix domain-containing protein [Maribrevibacterium harenarium]TPE55282.1 helix-turn-helix domain-containing protein [Maribrevibacterium harenarium]